MSPKMSNTCVHLTVLLEKIRQLAGDAQILYIKKLTSEPPRIGHVSATFSQPPSARLRIESSLSRTKAAMKRAQIAHYMNQRRYHE